MPRVKEHRKCCTFQSTLRQEQTFRSSHVRRRADLAITVIHIITWERCDPDREYMCCSAALTSIADIGSSTLHTGPHIGPIGNKCGKIHIWPYRSIYSYIWPYNIYVAVYTTMWTYILIHCSLGVWICILDVWTCFLAVWICFWDVWTSFVGVWILFLCQDLYI